jgi:ribulose-5-phosphate 4-epimerase/fuculose-1-phosphate aldolase
MGLVQHAQGNLSARIPGTECVLITPSGVPYRDMAPQDVVTVDLEGGRMRGVHEPSSETPVHVLAYRLHPGVGACIHVEPPYVNALYAVNRPIPHILGNYVYLFGGRGLAVGPSLHSGTREFAEASLRAMGDRFGVVWKNHGLFCVGQDIDLALSRCVAAEQAARVYWLALSVGAGEPDLIPPEVQQEMVETARRKGWSRAV